ncbi:TIGR01212 family radical SAM protein [Wukongibacter baidiensis]|uniref:TIGR01212 family radical SAM protein n=1 Tax=Wukongibacter baidiensis TaxID=1723361 RepID=UPI003D7F5043
MEEKKDRYRVYSKYLKEKYGEKVYKIPINLPITCPNRDGECGTGGCIFCGDIGTGFESLENTLSVKEQVNKNIEYIGKKYKAKKYIAYFQNFTNTYMPVSSFKEYVEEAASVDDIVEICISTRPDCINNSYLEILDNVRKKYGVEITVEMGLQSVNYKTLKKIKRGHTLAEFIDAMIKINSYNFESCCHLILNFPWDDMEDIIEAAKIVSALGINQVKLHSLYILEKTELGRMYNGREISIISVEEYVDRVVTFISYLRSEAVIQRLAGRAPKESTLFCNWDMSWWRIRDMIDERLEELDTYQGKECDYLNGKAVRKFVE